MHNTLRKTSNPRLEILPLSGMSPFSFKSETVKDTDFGWHFHSDIEINFVQKGHGMRFVGDSIEPFEDGDLVIIGPNLLHACPKPKRGESLQTTVIQFPLALFENTLNNIPDFASIGRMLDRSRQGLRVQGRGRIKAANLISEMAKSIPGSAQGLSQLLLLLSIIAENVDNRSLVHGPVRIPEMKSNDLRLQLIFKSIHDHLPDVYSETELADYLKMTAGSFSHFFKRSMGKSYLEYLIELRIGLACRALVDSDRAIVEVAFVAGFNNLSNFHRQFKKLKGITPQAYRKLACEDFDLKHG
jgi:AraC-like DNA-binding protein/mannose-6-phosphate isomerase-like protein (cupin superfamily)